MWLRVLRLVRWLLMVCSLLSMGANLVAGIAVFDLVILAYSSAVHTLGYWAFGAIGISDWPYANEVLIDLTALLVAFISRFAPLIRRTDEDTAWEAVSAERSAVSAFTGRGLATAEATSNVSSSKQVAFVRIGFLALLVMLATMTVLELNKRANVEVPIPSRWGQAIDRLFQDVSDRDKTGTHTDFAGDG